MSIYEMIRDHMDKSVPFATVTGVELVEVSPQRGVAALKKRPEVENHIQTMHAGAMFTLGEAASGAALGGVLGDQLMAGLRQLEAKHACVGDVRGMGLFLGLELINADGSEATGICSYVKNRMRDNRILIGSEGPKDNILKIRPPLTIDSDDVEMIVQTLDLILDEVAAL